MPGQYDDVKKAYDLGLKSEFELLQADVRHKDHIPKTTNAEKNYNVALINLKNLAGLPADNEIVLDGSLADYPELPQSMTMQTVLDNRPDFNALLWEERLRSTNVKAEKASYLPTLSGNLIYAYSAQSDRWSFDEENNSFTFGLSLSIPIFTGGANSARVQKAKIERDKTRIEIDRNKQNIERELESVRLRLKEAHDRISSADATRTAAKKAFSIAQSTSEVGLTTQLELKDSRVVLDQAIMGYYSAVYEFLDAYFDWEKAVGAVK